MSEAVENQARPDDKICERLEEICRERKADFKRLSESHGKDHPETCYMRGIYFGLLVALRVHNGGEPIRI